MANPIRIDLTGKNIVITGAGGVLCSAFAAHLAKNGARVALLDINAAAAEAAAENPVQRAENHENGHDPENDAINGHVRPSFRLKLQ